MLVMTMFFFHVDQQPGSQKLVSCITTLYLFSKIKPKFLLRHAKTLHPYLSTQCNVSANQPSLAATLKWEMSVCDVCVCVCVCVCVKERVGVYLPCTARSELSILLLFGHRPLSLTDK